MQDLPFRQQQSIASLHDYHLTLATAYLKAAIP